MDKQQRAEFIRRMSFTSDADRDTRAGFVDEIAETASKDAARIDWIDVARGLPAVGTWANVLVDWETGDYFDRRGKPRYEVFSAQLRDIDSEGYAHWQRWQMSDGGPMGSLWLVTHWQPLPAPPSAQPPSASDERERSDLLRELGKASVCACTCKAGTPDPAKHAYACRYRAIALARAALAPSPGVDAAEQKPEPMYQIKFHYDEPTGWHDATEYAYDLHPAEKRRIVYAAPPPAASADEWMAEAERLVDAYTDASATAAKYCGKPYHAAKREARSALLAHLKARP